MCRAGISHPGAPSLRPIPRIASMSRLVPPLAQRPSRPSRLRGIPLGLRPALWSTACSNSSCHSPTRPWICAISSAAMIFSRSSVLAALSRLSVITLPSSSSYCLGCITQTRHEFGACRLVVCYPLRARARKSLPSLAPAGHAGGKGLCGTTWPYGRASIPCLRRVSMISCTLCPNVAARDSRDSYESSLVMEPVHIISPSCVIVILGLVVLVGCVTTSRLS